ncbi:MAG: hypothetical protein V7L11_23655 [Nostoc sp.]
MSIKLNAPSDLIPDGAIALRKTSKTKRSPVVEECAIAPVE